MTPTMDFDNDPWIIPSRQQARRFYLVKCETNRTNGNNSPGEKKTLEFYILLFIKNLKFLVLLFFYLILFCNCENMSFKGFLVLKLHFHETNQNI